MKAYSLLFMMALSISACDLVNLEGRKKSSSKNTDAKKIAWDYLAMKKRANSITHPYQDAILDSSTWENKKSVTVLFNTTDDALLGPIVVHLDPKSLEVLGISPRY